MIGTGIEATIKLGQGNVAVGPRMYKNRQGGLLCFEQLFDKANHGERVDNYETYGTTIKIEIPNVEAIEVIRKCLDNLEEKLQKDNNDQHEENS